MNYKDRIAKSILKDDLLTLDKRELKLFYSILVHYWIKNQSFISKRNFFNLWCELNELCSKVDEGFPDPYDDHELLKSFCQTHPFYFIDRLSPRLVTNLFCQYLDDKIDILAAVVNKLRIEGLRAAYEHSNKTLGFEEDVEELITETEKYVKHFS